MNVHFRKGFLKTADPAKYSFGEEEDEDKLPIPEQRDPTQTSEVSQGASQWPIRTGLGGA